MFDLIANLLSFFYDIINSYITAIILLTLVVLIISTPLTLSGTRSMLKMQLLQPELKKIQDKHKNDREKMNAEMMEFYKENDINPVGGCLPMVFQIPVFLVLYRVILGLTRRASDLGSQFGFVSGELSEGISPTIYESGERQSFNPAYVSEDSQLYSDLSSSNEMTSFGFDLSRSASEVLGEGIAGALPYLALVLIVGITGWVQHWMIRRRQTGASINPTQELIMKMMPFFLPVFAFTLPAAIVFYFLASNLYRIAQQYYITRSMYTGEDSLGAQLRQRREDDKGSEGKSSKGGDNPKKNSPAKKNAGSKAKQGSGNKKKTKPSDRSKAPGRNSSGVSASARSEVQAKARKKKKR